MRDSRTSQAIVSCTSPLASRWAWTTAAAAGLPLCGMWAWCAGRWRPHARRLGLGTGQALPRGSAQSPMHSLRRPEAGHYLRWQQVAMPTGRAAGAGRCVAAAGGRHVVDGLVVPRVPQALEPVGPASNLCRSHWVRLTVHDSRRE